MNFGYPFTPYSPNVSQEQYMGNVGTNMPNMGGMNTPDYMNAQGMGCGCGMGAMNQGFSQPGCNQVVEQTCAVDMPYYVNYNTHGNTN